MPKRKPARGEVDWSTAEVADGRLTVALRGETSKQWAERVVEVAERLNPSAGWEVEVQTKQVRVGGIEPGAEDDVRFFLESLLAQANADFAPEEEDQSGEGQSPEDTKMTEAFRAFAGERGEGDEPVNSRR